MRCRAYHLVSGTIFAIVALIHLVRSLLAIPAHAGPWEIPMAVSWIATLGAALLALWAFRARPAA